MPILASRAAEIRRLLAALGDARTRAGAVLRLRGLGSRVVPHVEDEWGRLEGAARLALLEVLEEVETADARALRKRLARAGDAPEKRRVSGPGEDAEASALAALRALPPPRSDERPAISRERGEAHLTLARIGSRLARKELLLSLGILEARRARLYCEAAGLIGDAAFLASLARLASGLPEAADALSAIAAREKITARSRAVRDLDERLRPAVARALARA